MHERQEIEPASSTPTQRTVRNAPSEMACPYAAVFRLSASLVAHSSCIRLAIRSGQSHPVSWTQAQPPDLDRIAAALSGSGHSTAKEEHAPSVTLPPTSPHAIVRCGDTETHLFSSHPAIDASEASASRAWGPCRPVSPNDSTKASHEICNSPEECLDSAMAGRPRALFVTKRHKTSRFGHFC